MVSVIIPLYNSHDYIERCFKSIQEQDYKDLEIIVIDDGSTDGSGDVVDMMADHDDRVTVYHQKNQGLVFSRKQGIMKATGEYILFVDSDDYIDSDMIGTLVREAEDNKADVVASAANMIFEEQIKGHDSSETDAIKRLILNNADDGFYTEQALDDLKSKLMCMEDYYTTALLPYIWCKLWRRELITKHIMDADESITVGEDVAIGIPALLEAESIYVDNRAYYNYVQNSASMMKAGQDEPAEYENARRLYLYLRNKLKERDYYGISDRVLNKGLDRLFIHQMLTRAYGYLTERIGCEGVFPFLEKMPEEVIIYGAGEFGRSIYRYLSRKTNIRYWVDKNAECIEKLGYPVCTPDEVEYNRDDIIIVAILRDTAARRVVEDLIKNGASPENIILFSMEREVEEKYVNDLTHEHIFDKI